MSFALTAIQLRSRTRSIENGAFPTNKKEPAVRIELTTTRLQIEGSTTELHRHLVVCKVAWWFKWGTCLVQLLYRKYNSTPVKRFWVMVGGYRNGWRLWHRMHAMPYLLLSSCLTYSHYSYIVWLAYSNIFCMVAAKIWIYPNEHTTHCEPLRAC